jgi:hypothetical protein
LRKTNASCAYGEDAWFRRPKAGVKFLRNKFLRGDGGNRARLTKESAYKP